MFQTSHIELSESAIKSNISFISSLLNENVIFSAVVKGNAYGHGIANYCPIAYKHGIRHFSVFSAQEAFDLKKALPQNDYSLLIMGNIDSAELNWAIENEIEFYVFELDRLQQAIQEAKKARKKAKIHLELETGMNRTGFNAAHLKQIFHLVETNLDVLDPVGICSHLAGAEEIANYKRIKEQISRFKRMQQKINAFPWMKPQFHLASSAASIRYPATQFDLARIGILQFGFFPTQETYVHYHAKHKNAENPLKRVMSWKTKIMAVKTVKAGEFIGYGTSFLTNSETNIALLPVGYAFGYSRSLSNQGKVLLRGKRLDVIGSVNMNMLAIDVTGLENVQKGEEVILIGNQGEGEISVASFSDYSQLINYELLTRLPQDIPRSVVL